MTTDCTSFTQQLLACMQHESMCEEEEQTLVHALTREYNNAKERTYKVLEAAAYDRKEVVTMCLHSNHPAEALRILHELYTNMNGQKRCFSPLMHELKRERGSGVRRYLHSSESWPVVAAQLGKMDAMRYLLDVNDTWLVARNSRFGNGLMAEAVVGCNSSPALLNCIHSRIPFDVHLPNKCGFTPLLLAAATGQLTVFQHLVDSLGARIDVTTHQGDNALMVAARYGRLLMVQWILHPDRKGKYTFLLRHEYDGYRNEPSYNRHMGVDEDHLARVARVCEDICSHRVCISPEQKAEMKSCYTDSCCGRYVEPSEDTHRKILHWFAGFMRSPLNIAQEGQKPTLTKLHNLDKRPIRTIFRMAMNTGNVNLVQEVYCEMLSQSERKRVRTSIRENMKWLLRAGSCSNVNLFQWLLPLCATSIDQQRQIVRHTHYDNFSRAIKEVYYQFIIIEISNSPACVELILSDHRDLLGPEVYVQHKGHSALKLVALGHITRRRVAVMRSMMNTLHRDVHHLVLSYVA
jgi:hypothetical protein